MASISLNLDGAVTAFRALADTEGVCVTVDIRGRYGKDDTLYLHGKRAELRHLAEQLMVLSEPLHCHVAPECAEVRT